MASALPLRTRADFTRWVLARLRHHRFDTVAQVDAAITELLSSVNDRPFQKLPGSRASVFAELDAPTLMSLPRQPYELARFKTVKVHIDYHVEMEGHRYSVPHALVGHVDRESGRPAALSSASFSLTHLVIRRLRAIWAWW